MSAPERRPAARAVAFEILKRCESQGAYANLVTPAVLGRTDLDRRDRAFVTQLVYGTVRMARACDFLIDRFLLRPVDADVRVLLRLGAYQLAFLNVPAHAAVSQTVELASKRVRGFVNAVLRRVADNPIDPAAQPSQGGWPNIATQLSYPDWIVERLVNDLGADDALGALASMNSPARVHERDDGYIQDLASQWVAEAVGAAAGERVLDLCAAPGGKATALASTDANVVAVELHEARMRLVVDNARRTGTAHRIAGVIADGTKAPVAAASFDRVLVDAPCSGVGSLRRRPDARWHIDPSAVDRLVPLQRSLVASAAEAVRPGGVLVVSVCTLLDAETIELDAWLAENLPAFDPLDPLGEPWQPAGRGERLLPQTRDTDGMALYRYRRA